MIVKKMFFDAEKSVFRIVDVNTHEPTKILFDPRTMSLTYNFVLEDGDVPHKDYPILTVADALAELKENMILILDDHINAFKKEIKKIRRSKLIQ